MNKKKIMNEENGTVLDAADADLNEELTDEENAAVDEAAANILGAENTGVWTYTLKEPLEYQEQTFSELTFDFDKLRGADMIAIEHELDQLDISVFSDKGFSDAFALRAAALACESIDNMFALEELWGVDYNTVLRRTRTYLSMVKMTEVVPRRAWKWELKEPIDIKGKTYTALEFDYRKIKGRSLLNITNVLTNEGKRLYSRYQMSIDYALRVAAAACNVPLEASDLERLGAAEFTDITTRAKLFLAGIAV